MHVIIGMHAEIAASKRPDGYRSFLGVQRTHPKFDQRQVRGVIP
jgi:hypothetical protein